MTQDNFLVEEEGSDPQTYIIIGAAMMVHRTLGCGFLEAVYQAALERELRLRKVDFVREERLPISYRGEIIAEYRADFVCFKEVIVELKALSDISGHEEAQIINYLKATKIERGLLINFGTTRLQYKRYILSRPSAP